MSCSGPRQSTLEEEEERGSSGLEVSALKSRRPRGEAETARESGQPRALGFGGKLA